MGKDSAKALELVRLSKVIQKPLVEKYNGQWLKEMGDGALAKFCTALDAVNCAIEIQELFISEYVNLRVALISKGNSS
jgi:class 3 adenylate cyclase